MGMAECVPGNGSGLGAIYPDGTGNYRDSDMGVVVYPRGDGTFSTADGKILDARGNILADAVGSGQAVTALPYARGSSAASGPLRPAGWLTWTKVAVGGGVVLGGGGILWALLRRRGA